MKKRILSLILALSMVLSVLPLGAFAEGSTNGKELVMKNGLPGRLHWRRLVVQERHTVSE